ncbi:hypothetical protein [Streptomyces sp. MNU103]|uniref:hypothetical protein n=1 Tax=Streptomyces sp. MNU103 TaxID=2560024 RepID=UPI001E5F1EEE|nr:hypothetical protein [Streptomyces sp. MNU103]
MNPVADLLFRLAVIVAFFGLVAAVTTWRRQTAPDAAEVSHDPRTCTGCAELRHPSNRHARIALAALPRQRKGDR